jgi:hypothetical protein
MDRYITKLEASLAKLLVQLDNGWTPADFSLPAFKTVLLNQKPWQGTVLGIQLELDTLLIRLQGNDAEVEEFSNKRITAVSEEDGRLEAWDSHITIHYGSPSEIEIRCQQWSYTPFTKPLLWVARLQHITEISTLGNLFTYHKQGTAFKSSITGVRLTTENIAIYLLNTKVKGEQKQVLLAFESLNELPLTCEQVDQELRLLRIVLSTTMQPHLFLGLNAQAQTTAALAASSSQASMPVNSPGYSPAPIRYSDAGNRNENRRLAWLAPFYQKLRPFYLTATEANSVAYSLTRYANSLAPMDIDTQFELVAGAVWILLHYLYGTHVGVSENTQSRINQRSPIDKAVNWLTEEYKEAGIQVGAELMAAIQELIYGTLADYSHEFPTRDFLRQRYNRVQRLRHAYAVLLSRAIGYQGAINDFEPWPEKPVRPDQFNNSQSKESELSGWLPSPSINEAERVEALRVFRAEADTTGLSVWPVFELPSLPQDELLKAFSFFAEEVRYQTQGKISARLRPFPRRDGEPLHLSFRLMVDKAPTTQVALCTLELLKKGFEVQGWGDKPLRVTTPKSLEKFQQTLLASPEFKYQVERLLLIEEDIRRGEA